MARDLTIWAPLERMMEDIFSTGFGNVGVNPKMEVSETDEAYILKAELPGLTKDDIAVQLEDSVLTISGEKKHERSEDKKSFHLCEITYGSFSRSFQVPNHVKSEDIEANFKDGILTLTLPKAEEVTPKKIDVQ